MNNPLQGTVKIAGRPVKKIYVVAGVTITAAILAWAYYRRATGSAADTPAAADPEAATDPYALGGDATGGTSGGGSGGGGSSDTPWPYGYDANGNPLPAPVPGGTTDPGGTTTSNSDWLTAGLALLEEGGMTAEVASAALTGVLGGLGVTSDQEATFLRVVGALGNPPQGYPRPIKLVSPPSDPAPTPAPAAPAAPPTQTAGKKAPAKPSGLKVSAKTTTTVTLDWTPVSGATGYVVYRNGARIVSVAYSTAKLSNMKANTSYTFAVQTIGTEGQVSALASINAKTAAAAAAAPKLTELAVTSSTKKK